MKKSAVRIAVIAISIAFILIGIYRGETSEILSKAISICLQCIGIG